MPPPKEIEIIGRKFRFAVPLGSAPAWQTAGGAVYEEQPRPGAVAMTVYAGDALIKMDVPVLFDSWRAGKANQRSRIEQLMNLARSTNGNRPPDFQIKGPIINSGMRFQMEPVEWVDTPTPIMNNGGAILRQALVLHLIEYQNPDTLRFKRQRFGKGAGLVNPSNIILPRPETLVQVAARVLDDPGRAKALGKANGIRDIRKTLPKGTTLRLPGDG